VSGLIASDRARANPAWARPTGWRHSDVTPIIAREGLEGVRDESHAEDWC